MTAADREAVELAMERMGVSGWRERSLRELSGGERQRVYLAMALCQESGNLLLDEPSAWLDAPRQFELLELLKSLAAEGKTVVMVLHELAQAMQYADKIALLVRRRAAGGSAAGGALCLRARRGGLRRGSAPGPGRNILCPAKGLISAACDKYHVLFRGGLHNIVNKNGNLYER
jgi:ABC-type cobalamin/Fe3+-siderophores transport system ATPase subunit